MTERPKGQTREANPVDFSSNTGATEEIEVRGHIVDSLLLPKILDRILLMGANPGVVLEEIAVHLPSPRTAALRSESRFLDLVGQVSRALAAIHP